MDHGNGIFVIQQANECNTLRFGEDNIMPHCTCRDWQIHLLPCKHFCAVFIHFPSWQWVNLSAVYQNNPIFALDDAFIVTMETHPLEEAGGGGKDTRRKRALQECMDTTKAINAAVKRLQDSSHIMSVNKKLRSLLEDVQSSSLDQSSDVDHAGNWIMFTIVCSVHRNFLEESSCNNNKDNNNNLTLLALQNYYLGIGMAAIRPKIKTSCIALCDRPTNLKIYGRNFKKVFFFNRVFDFFFLLMNTKICICLC